ncbi:MAG TPA: S-layer related protein (Precursor), partial [Planctomycetaceae bacterium]|nr:S-layer related protein (Precursor) [Planctomycetaceae bacterium]
ELGIEPSGLCDDATFVRRVTLDLIGTLPSPQMARDFIDSKHPDKRQRLIDELLGLTGDPARDRYNDLYAAWWTLKWSD